MTEPERSFRADTLGWVDVRGRPVDAALPFLSPFSARAWRLLRARDRLGGGRRRAISERPRRLMARARAFPSPPSSRAARGRGAHQSAAGARPRPGGSRHDEATRAARGSPPGTIPGRGDLRPREADGELPWE